MHHSVSNQGIRAMSLSSRYTRANENFVLVVLASPVDLIAAGILVCDFPPATVYFYAWLAVGVSW